jgi:hypothetical protein
MERIKMTETEIPTSLYDADGQLIDTEGNKVTNPSKRDELVIRLAWEVYADPSLLTQAVEYCSKKGKEQTSLEQYVDKHFGMLVSKFPKVRDEYVEYQKQKRKKIRRSKQWKKRQLKK